MSRKQNNERWHVMDPNEVLRRLRSDGVAGLSDSEVASRQREFGPNELIERRGAGPFVILLKQFTSTVVVVLIGAAVLSLALRDYTDAGMIGVIVVLNALLGFNQEYRAEKAMAALRRMAVPRVRVRRDSALVEISARELVPGDIVVLEAGNLVAADSRVLQSINLRIQEAALTGESEPVNKDFHAVSDEDAPLGERTSMVFMGTIVTAGRGLAVVTATGMDTQLGQIASMIQEVRREPTPLEVRLAHLGRILVLAALAIVILIFVVGLMRGEPFRLMLLTAVSIAVAAVPEGLPAVVTIALSLGAQRMLRRNALIRKLPAVETLGSVTVICSDKTGTLTENQMSVVEGRVANKRVIFSPKTTCDKTVEESEEARQVRTSPDLQLLLIAGALCNDAQLESGDQSLSAVGDPTEAALIVAGARFGLMKDVIERSLPRVAEVPFESERRLMTTVHRLPTTGLPDDLRCIVQISSGAQYIEFTKGAADSLAEISTHVLVNGRIAPMDAEASLWINTANTEMAREGMRVLGVAFRLLDSLPAIEEGEALEQDLVFIGLVGMLDPPRREAKDAVARCGSAGIRTLMITGDHPLTARAIARELRIGDDREVVTGKQLSTASAEQIDRIVGEAAVFARVSPAHKLRLVQSLQSLGEIVAMTGDGVNDAPALKRANIGIAMGVTGTDVAKQAADMVLLDDNFATIVAAVEEGRVIYDNVRKFIRYILATNSGELWLMLLAPAIGMPLPLLPLQILWVNLVSDGLPAVALALEPPERIAMSRPPYPPDETILGRGLGWHVIWVGLLMGLLALVTGYLGWRSGVVEWQTTVFTTITLAQMAHVMAIRSERDSLFRIGVFSNRPLVGAVLLTVALQIALLYVPILQRAFKTYPLSLGALLMSVLIASLIFWAVEIEKAIRRRRAGVPPSVETTRAESAHPHPNAWGKARNRTGASQAKTPTFRR